MSISLHQSYQRPTESGAWPTTISHHNSLQALVNSFRYFIMEHSHITLNLRPFDHSNISPTVAVTNKKIKKIPARVPPWWEVGAQKYREMRRNGETVWPKSPTLDGTSTQIPSREGARMIPIRVMKPDKYPRIRSMIMYGRRSVSLRSYCPIIFAHD